MKSSYLKFLVMVLTSTLVMFGLMYLNTYELSHVFWSETRLYMAFIMGAVMTIIMLLFMWNMYENFSLNLRILIVSIIVFAGALFLVRSQSTIDDVAWMKAMIPHHSIAILTSERVKITDPRVRELADGIIATQRKEIDEMEMLIKDLETTIEGSENE